MCSLLFILIKSKLEMWCLTTSLYFQFQPQNTFFLKSLSQLQYPLDQVFWKGGVIFPVSAYFVSVLFNFKGFCNLLLISVKARIFKIFTDAALSTNAATFWLAILTVVIKFSRVSKTWSLNQSLTANRYSSLWEYTSSKKIFSGFLGTEGEWGAGFCFATLCVMAYLFALIANLRFSRSFYFMRIDTTASETCLIIITHSSPVQIAILTGSAWRSTKGVNCMRIRLLHLIHVNFHIFKGFCYS